MSETDIDDKILFDSDQKTTYSTSVNANPMQSLDNKAKIRTRSRRGSSLGRIDLGDTVRSLGTMPSSKQEKKASKNRLKVLSMESKGDRDLLKKIWISYREMAYRNTWLNPLILLLIVYFMYFTSGNRTETNPLHQFMYISYQIGDTDQYGKGIKDLSFVFFHMIFFTFIREFLMDVVIKPVTIYVLKVTSPHRIKRIMEQVYTTCYTGVSGPFGIYIMYHSDLWLFETKTMYVTYPDLYNSYLYKLFYLGQASFWAQQACVLVLQLEKPRKDHKELIFHHIVTLLLIWSSYVFHFTKMGLAVYITMDVTDCLLALSKTLNYLESPLASPLFAFFFATWLYLRHYINLKILWSVLTQFRTEGPYILNFATQQYKCWISLPIVFSLIFALQLLNVYWVILIIRVLYRIIFLGIEKDERSDSESDSEEDSEVSSESGDSEGESPTKAKKA
ncbi:hypothetical protein TPHA_0G03260 [Tetrapisispora phaffii CBS 4417]|uniref:TLC domain-containing protein n=1 Tax=Tetrapisispora phaffii (strain ATCC 24235 / CBS 4417 / NBRC 1672 / NRRL Y-8282 / UCD 70-5) TaxID=1071381 RepID=G8BW88_TETPH|nr:hypothetical protein TPHA_0G03260 [Tetrapisispora phaffii CBS 4417]CCE64166.1 hypothetical protein TPHA_0G03260 [Tetrapisispora phaffii CBS 4417]